MIDLLKVIVCLYQFIPISAYNYFYMIKIIRAVHSIIPAIEQTFLSIHAYLYSKFYFQTYEKRWLDSQLSNLLLASERKFNVL